MAYKITDDCISCGACAADCPVEAISEGDGIYVIDADTCIDCGACKKICVFSREKNKNEYKCYACVNKNDSLIMKSASGGAFSAIASAFLESGGHVCGAVTVLEKGIITIEHKVINNVEHLYQLQGSKYVQSSTLSAFEEIQKILKKGEKVLFSGTPCQVDAIKNLCKQYVGKSLFTIDIICHGVPSQKFLNGYLQEYQKRKKSCLTYIDFRNKKYGWGLTGVTKFIDKDDSSISPVDSSYYKLFLEGEIYRENCYKCPYANLNRVGDLTIGDYWGFQELSPELKSNPNVSDRKGVSCLIVNNYIGNNLLNEFGGDLFIYPVEVEKVMVINTQLREPAKYTSRRKNILNTFVKKGYGPIEKSFQRKLKVRQCKTIMKKLLPEPIKKIIKCIIEKIVR